MSGWAVLRKTSETALRSSRASQRRLWRCHSGRACNAPLRKSRSSGRAWHPHVRFFARPLKRGGSTGQTAGAVPGNPREARSKKCPNECPMWKCCRPPAWRCSREVAGSNCTSGERPQRTSGIDRVRRPTTAVEQPAPSLQLMSLSCSSALKSCSSCPYLAAHSSSSANGAARTEV